MIAGIALLRGRSLDAVPRFYDVGFERYRAWAAVEFEEEAAGVAEDGAGLVAAPEGGGGGAAVLADGLVRMSHVSNRDRDRR